ncbi:hypothetical protein ZOSMA_317G00060 [Zostera marina]|uniref:VQ domain-containing protein n=1 Tax=Zostera marina TaxID=29655 RepID=A0A0K9PBL5_ZOSMR|nr:hypothetical protein ZOSMA_317G00060 [Zostera marina]
MSTNRRFDVGPKVKVIVTRFVQTDANSFKSVVQNLTGVNSTMAEEEGRDVDVKLPPVVTTACTPSSDDDSDASAGNMVMMAIRLELEEFDRTFMV